jgi:hypothetical protein
MKFLTATLLTLLLAFVSGLYLPWWGIAIVALLVAAIVHQKAGKAFLSGFWVCSYYGVVLLFGLI